MKEGFPRGVNFTPVPDPLLASLLEEFDSLDELKVILRTIHALHRQRKVPASISISDLYSDRTVAAMLHTSGRELEEVVQSAVKSASKRGILLILETDGIKSQIFLNTEPVRRALVRHGLDIAQKHDEPVETWAITEAASDRLDAITFYEHNVGHMTPLIAENIRTALEQHPEDEVLLAIRKATEANARNWNYIAAILRRWAIEGRPEELEHGRNGTTERDLEEDRSDQFYGEYLKRQRARGAN
ncbi:MAG: DnaD domain protein [SAR202 cluster bacterium]|nr:DnaD domain protein [SAR202 cluster bacterium]